MKRVSALWRWSSSGRVWDTLVAAVILALTVGGAYGEAHPKNPSDRLVHGHPVPHTPTGAFFVVGVAAAVLVFRRRNPLATLTISTAAVAVYSILGYVNGAALLAPTVALYALTSTSSPRKSIGAAAITLVVLMGATAANNPFGITGGGFYLLPALIIAACFGGISVCSRRAYVASVKERAEEDARRLVDEERLRIARELHDVVAHTMATINVEAGVAAHLLPDRPDQAAAALQSIKTASKQGLQELRAVLNVLRRVDERDPTEPAPGLVRLSALVDGVVRSGLPTRVVVDGQPALLPQAVDVAAYRIVQEALTNCIRHAGPATAQVTIRYGDDALDLSVTDTGAGPPAVASGGHGLAGMRERAASVGGSVDAGPGPAGGFAVRAHLPLYPNESAAADMSTTPEVVR